MRKIVSMALVAAFGLAAGVPALADLGVGGEVCAQNLPSRDGRPVES